jgi:hypothetical protein
VQHAKQDAAVTPEQQQEVAAPYQLSDTNAEPSVEGRDIRRVADAANWPFDVSVRGLRDNVAEIRGGHPGSETEAPQHAWCAVDLTRTAAAVRAEPDCGRRPEERQWARVSRGDIRYQRLVRHTAELIMAWR